MGVVETTCIPTLAEIGVPMGIGGTTMTTTYDCLVGKGFKVTFPLHPIVTHSSFFPLVGLARASLGVGLILSIAKGQSLILCSMDWHL